MTAFVRHKIAIQKAQRFEIQNSKDFEYSLALGLQVALKTLVEIASR